MPRILIAECKQEVSTFNPVKSGYQDFNIFRGQELFDHYRSVHAEVSGALHVFDGTAEVELIAGYGASSITSGGTLYDESWFRIADEFLTAIREAHPLDAFYLSLHGAMATESEFDPEGYLIAESRKILGEEIPIVVSLDLHGIATDLIFEKSDAIVAFHTYPHVDFFETGQRAARVLLDILSGKIKPVTARVAIPALVRGDELITKTGAIGRTVRAAKHIEESSGGISAGIFIGNPFTDVPALQSYAFVVTDDDSDRAGHEALELAKLFWEDHEKMQVPLIGLGDAMSELVRQTSGTVALVDAADATSSGASGDSNAILRALIKTGYQGSVLSPLVDPSAVDAAFEAGVGGSFLASLGGALDPDRFQPLEMEVTVRLLADGRVISESFSEEWNSGPTAVLESRNFTIVVSTRAIHLFDRSFFFAHGQNPRNFDAVVVKSPHCEPHMYQDWCTRMLNIDAPGSTSANLKSLGHTRCPRPIFPLDEQVSFQPVATIYRRKN